jgi:hypothetical protein
LYKLLPKSYAQPLLVTISLDKPPVASDQAQAILNRATRLLFDLWPALHSTRRPNAYNSPLLIIEGLAMGDLEADRVTISPVRGQTGFVVDLQTKVGQSVGHEYPLFISTAVTDPFRKV